MYNLSMENSQEHLKIKKNQWKNFYFIEYKFYFDKMMMSTFFLLIIIFPLLVSIIVKYTTSGNIYFDLFPIIQFGLPAICFVIFIFRYRVKFFSRSIFLFFLVVPLIRMLFYSLNIVFNVLDLGDKTLNEILAFFLNIFFAIIQLACCFWFAIKTKIFKQWFIKAFCQNNFLRTIIIIGIATMIFFVLQLLLSFIPGLIGSNGSSGNQSSLEQMTSSVFGTINLFIASVIVAPIFEEIFYRYYIIWFSNNSLIGYFLSVVYFASLHVMTYGDFENIFPYFALGIVNGFIFYYFNNLAPAILVHFFANLFSFITILLIK